MFANLLCNDVMIDRSGLEAHKDAEEDNLFHFPMKISFRTLACLLIAGSEDGHCWCTQVWPKLGRKNNIKFENIGKKRQKNVNNNLTFRIVDLNVGGVLYTTSVETLTKVCEKYLALQNKKKAAMKKARIELRLTLRNI